MAPKKAATKKSAPETTKGFVVYDSNGKKFREVKDREDAEYLATVVGGKVK